MINVQEVLRDVPHFETFCSVAKLHGLVETLRGESSACTVEVAGTSVCGEPIHHVRFGNGSAKALVVAFPHCHEPIGSLTVFTLMRLLHQGNRALAQADVEWHIVPCIDPDGALLNEGWTQKPFTFRNYMRSRHLQPWVDQVDCSFPITYKKLVFNQPSKEAKILQGLLDRIRPDFFFTLHNWIAAGGAWYGISHDIGQKYYLELHELREQHHIPIQVSIAHQKWCAQFGEGIFELFVTKKLYDDLEQTLPSPERFLPMGAASWEYLAEIKHNAVAFVAELPHLKYPSDGLKSETGQNLRQLKLRLEADNKFLITVILEEWEKVKEDLDTESPFYRKVLHEIVSIREKLCEGMPLSASSTQDILFNPAYGRTMTAGERFDTYVGDRFDVLCHSYEFVRLLNGSKQSPAVRQATERLERLFDEALDDIAKDINLDDFNVIDCDTLAKVQLGSGLIALNSVLEAHAKVAKAV